MFDPFGIHNQINSMMRGFMVDPFAPPSQQQQQQQQQQQRQNNNGRGGQMALSPFEQHNQMMMHQNPFGMMNSMMSNMHGANMFSARSNFGGPGGMLDQHFVSTDPNAQVFSSSSVVTYSNSGDGRPKVYQESKQIRHGPGGVRETRELVRDSTKGLEKVAIGHHIGERAHIIERQKMNNGPVEEIVNLENLDEGSFCIFRLSVILLNISVTWFLNL
jgi:myeloid leukemia factor 1